MVGEEVEEGVVQAADDSDERGREEEVQTGQVHRSTFKLVGGTDTTAAALQVTSHSDTSCHRIHGGRAARLRQLLRFGSDFWVKRAAPKFRQHLERQQRSLTAAVLRVQALPHVLGAGKRYGNKFEKIYYRAVRYYWSNISIISVRIVIDFSSEY